MPIHELGFKETIHEPWLYYKRDVNDNITLTLHQEDDFWVANKSSKEFDRIGKQIQDRMINPFKYLGTRLFKNLMVSILIKIIFQSHSL